jgi:hypothetical protein
MIDPARYSYSRNERNFLIRNEDHVPILEDENNGPYQLYLEWVKLGNDPIPLHTISPTLYPSRVDPSKVTVSKAIASDFTYSRNENNVIMRNDGVLVFEHPDDPVYQLYLEWLAEGNEPPAEVPPIPQPPPPYGSFITPTPIRFNYHYNETNILTRSDGVFIPENDPHNPAYKLYLEWLAEGNEPPPLNDISDLPEISPVYHSPYSPHSPVYGTPTPLPSETIMNFEQFIASSIMSRLVIEDGLKIYVTKTNQNMKNINGDYQISVVVIDTPGSFTRFLDKYEPIYRFYIKNIVSDRVVPYFERRGYIIDRELASQELGIPPMLGPTPTHHHHPHSHSH